MGDADWARVRAKLGRGVAIFACVAVVNLFPVLKIHRGYAWVVEIFVALTGLTGLLWYLARLRLRILVEVGTILLGPMAALVALGQFVGGGFFFLLSPLALLDDSGNAGKNIAAVWLLASIWMVSGLFSGWGAWQLLSAVGSIGPPYPADTRDEQTVT